MQLTLDGYVGGPNGELDWMVWDWDEELKRHTQKITNPVDCIVLGRKLAEGFIPYWTNVAADAAHPENSAGKKFTDTAKVVFTKTLNKAEWDNTILAKGDLAKEINSLKSAKGGDIITYGGANFVSSLIQNNLIDEYHLYVNPTAIGKGLPIFNTLENRLNLQLVQAKSFECGIVVLCYKPEGK